MHRHASLNKAYRTVWNHARQCFVVVGENAKSHTKAKSSSAAAGILAAGSFLLIGAGAMAADLPAGGQIVGGSGSISTNGTTMTVTQNTARLATNWDSFSIGQGHTVQFNQPSSSSVALNRVLGADVSVIQGALKANGQVFLLNPNGVLFTPTAQVNVGGIVASTLNMSTADFMAGNYRFEGGSSNAIINQGNITAANGGTIALIAAKITNDGTLTADKGNVLLGAGSKVTLDMGGPVKLQIENDALETLIQNGGAIKADGGVVWLTSQAANNLASSVINNTGLIEAQTLATGEKGEIILFAHDGTANVGGTLDASAPHGGNGGFIETSAANISFTDDLQISTRAALGLTGSWLIDPTDFTIGSADPVGSVTGGTADGSYIKNTTLQAALNATDVLIATSATGSEAGNINVNAPVTWSTNRLTLQAHGDININAVMTANSNGKLTLTPGSGKFVNMKMDGSGFVGRVDFFSDVGTTAQTGAGFLTISGQGYTLINNATDLAAMTTNNSTVRYALANNITSGMGGWTPVGGGNFNGSPTFQGKFDGLGHTIGGLTVTKPSSSGAGNYGLGLFGETSSAASISNVGLTSPVISGGYQFVGTLVGRSRGQIRNAFASNVSVSSTGWSEVGGLVGTMNGAQASITNAYVTGAVAGRQDVGGLVGMTSGGVQINSSFSSANVSFASGASNWGVGRFGGLVGSFNDGTISNSYATGTVDLTGGGSFAVNLGVGGLIGATNATVTITNAYASGLVTPLASDTTATGGFIGQRDGGGGGGTITGSYWNNETTGLATGVGSGATTGITGKTTAQMQTQSEYIGWDFTTPKWSITTNNYPVLCAFTTCTPPTPPIVYTLSDITRTYTGSPIYLTDLWSASSIFGASYSSWVLGTDYRFRYFNPSSNSTSTVTSFTNAGAYSGIYVALIGNTSNAFSLASSGNTLGNLVISQPASASTTTTTTTTTTTNTVPQNTAVATVQSTVVQPVLNTQANSNIVSLGAPPPTVVVSQQGTLPVINVNGGLAFVSVNSQSGQGGGSTAPNIQSVADLPPDVGGRDPLGYMQVLVVGGGVYTPGEPNLPNIEGDGSRRNGLN